MEEKEYEDAWSDSRYEKLEKLYDKVFEPYERLGFEPFDDVQLKLFGFLLIALIPAILGFVVNICYF